MSDDEIYIPDVFEVDEIDPTNRARLWTPRASTLRPPEPEFRMFQEDFAWCAVQKCPEPFLIDFVKRRRVRWWRNPIRWARARWRRR